MNAIGQEQAYVNMNLEIYISLLIQMMKHTTIDVMVSWYLQNV